MYWYIIMTHELGEIYTRDREVSVHSHDSTSDYWFRAPHSCEGAGTFFLIIDVVVIYVEEEEVGTTALPRPYVGFSFWYIYVYMKKTPELYDIENESRKRIEFSARSLPNVKIWQIRWYYVGVNIGQEISRSSPYMRPCIILKIFKESSLIHIVPLSWNEGRLCKECYIPVHKHEMYRLRPSRAMLHQCKTIDKKRLIKIQSQNRVPAWLLTYIHHHKI